MRTALITAFIALAATAQAADIIVSAGGITVPSAAVADVEAWLETERIVTHETVIVTTTNDVGEIDHRVRSVEVVTPETPRQKLRRIYRAAGGAAIRQGLKAFRQARADALVQDDVEALPDPLEDEVTQ